MEQKAKKGVCTAFVCSLLLQHQHPLFLPLGPPPNLLTHRLSFPTKLIPTPPIPMTVIIPSSYPVKGIFYMLTHPQLFSNLICPILITMIWGIAALIFGFSYLLKLQAHALINVKCPAAVAW